MNETVIPCAPTVDTERVIRAVATAASSWLDGGWPDQQGLTRRMAERCGYSTAVVTAGMNAHLGAMSEAELRRWVGQGSGHGGTGQFVAILPATNLPGIALIPSVAALLAGARLLVKTSAAEPFFMSAWKDCLVLADSGLGPWIEVTEWVGGVDPEEEIRLAACDTIILLGADATVADLQRRHGRRVIGLGTGISLAVVSAAADLRAAASRLARDVAIWDQRGCLSPHGIVLVGPEEDAQTLMTHLVDSLRDMERELPVGPHSMEEAAVLRTFRADLAARRLAGDTVEWFDSGDVGRPRRWLVWRDGLSAFEPSPGRRHVRVWHVSNPDELVEQALPPRAHLQSVGLDASDPAAPHLEAVLRAAGVPVISSLGSMQAPPVDWPNKGRHLLRELMSGGPA